MQLTYAVVIAIWTAIIAPFRGQKGGGALATAYKHITLSFARVPIQYASMEQIQSV